MHAVLLFVLRICAFVMVYFSPIETTCGFIEFEMCFSNPNMDQLNLLNKEKMDQKMCVTSAKQDGVSNSCEFQLVQLISDGWIRDLWFNFYLH